LILNNSPENQAVMSNVAEIGEFRIRNSAKAFSILSSGLYANKIRAIIRELSCNAVDSHTAAGKTDTPFDVHLPNQIDPTFRIRDYGTGLSHEQVLSIYTTYFESTKTESNQFIGALGLGSKSPFSYTDNFTVTAIKDGSRNVYSAFINGEGVPSIALMHSEPSDQPNGVEVQFAVTDRWDYDKFRQEAREVYTYFALRPVVTGGDREFEFRDVEYSDKNIVPGVHYLSNGRSSRAVMGNISYPIDVPNSDSNLGSLARLLSCGLEMHFAIGELDFQASREGLSYIPSTIESIKNKLIALDAQLAVHLALEADAIINEWEKAYFLSRKANETLWSQAVRSYIANNPVALIDPNSSSSYLRTLTQKLDVKALANNHNISVLAFGKSRNGATCHEIKPHKEYKDKTYTEWDEEWQFSVDAGTVFVQNNLKVGALSRAKYHWRNAQSKGVELPNKGYQHNVYVLSPAVKGKVMDLTGFFAAIHNPPAEQILLASALIEKERKDNSGNRAKDVRILRLAQKDYGRRDIKTVWDEAGRADQYDANTTYYYIPLSGYVAVDTKLDPKDLHTYLQQSGVTALKELAVYGVRKGDIEWVKGQKNWVPVEQHISDVLGKLNANALAVLATSEVDAGKLFGYNKDIAPLIANASSPYAKLTSKFRGVERVRFSKHSLNRLLTTYAPSVSIDSVIEELKVEMTAVQTRYPLLNSVQDWNINALAVAEYINLVDSSKGV
jgi:hypothetical protein